MVGIDSGITEKSWSKNSISEWRTFGIADHRNGDLARCSRAQMTLAISPAFSFCFANTNNFRDRCQCSQIRCRVELWESNTGTLQVLSFLYLPLDAHQWGKLYLNFTLLRLCMSVLCVCVCVCVMFFWKRRVLACSKTQQRVECSFFFNLFTYARAFSRSFALCVCVCVCVCARVRVSHYLTVWCGVVQA